MKNLRILLVPAVVLGLSGCAGCGPGSPGPVAVSGVKEAKPEVHTDPDGHTTEQKNIIERYKMDSQPGSIKHLYVFSAASGDCILYSPVRGKVTSSGKRLSPTTINGSGQDVNTTIPVNISGRTRYTTEVLQDDGTYGSSTEYLYWFDTTGKYRQLYPAAGLMIIVSEDPLDVTSVKLKMEITEKKK